MGVPEREVRMRGMLAFGHSLPWDRSQPKPPLVRSPRLLPCFAPKLLPVRSPRLLPGFYFPPGVAPVYIRIQCPIILKPHDRYMRWLGNVVAPNRRALA
ncbi:uncharacterized protein LOC134474974 isoform X6 [Cavia porcellus]|uniref:uncharacterized protein LOC134474974 isoform X6 n=1 Tax=Cavia porcellus TaxID=10141 RepID=UPI002FDF364F